MAHIQLTKADLIVTLSVKDTIAAMRHKFTIPLTAISEVEVLPEPSTLYNSPLSTEHSLRIMGTRIPGVVSEGTFTSDSGLTFLEVYDGQPALSLTVTQGHYTTIVVSIDPPDNPTDIAAAIRQAIRAATQ